MRPRSLARAVSHVTLSIAFPVFFCSSVLIIIPTGLEKFLRLVFCRGSEWPNHATEPCYVLWPHPYLTYFDTRRRQHLPPNLRYAPERLCTL